MTKGQLKHRCNIRRIVFKPGKSPLGYKVDTYFGWYVVSGAYVSTEFNENFGVSRQSHYIWRIKAIALHRLRA